LGLLHSRELVVQGRLDVAPFEIELAEGVSCNNPEKQWGILSAEEGERVLVAVRLPRTHSIGDGAYGVTEFGGAEEKHTVFEKIEVIEDSLAVVARELTLEACGQIGQRVGTKYAGFAL